ncbi:hypothetical protein ThvES_00014650 [Thiovulum sp. ES]|nr:hypothetical protein ThvES_00014650 [Thiovulum sp. ES]
MKKIVFLIILSVISIAEDLEKYINYTGSLSSVTGRYTGTKELSVLIYDSAEDGSLLWEEKQTINFLRGRFSIKVGDVKNLDLAFDKQYWMTFSIENQEMSPRILLGSVPYSLNAEVVRKNLENNVSNILNKMEQNNNILENKINEKMSLSNFTVDGKIDSSKIEFANQENLNVGKFSSENEDDIFSVGNGTSESNRSSVFSVTDRNISVSGEIFTNGKRVTTNEETSIVFTTLENKVQESENSLFQKLQDENTSIRKEIKEQNLTLTSQILLSEFNTLKKLKRQTTLFKINSLF